MTVTKADQVGTSSRTVVRLDATDEDLAALNDLLRSGVRIGNEHADDDSDLHLDGIIPKPWGYEYRVFTDDFVDVWHLRMGRLHSTSMHAHPRKATYLLCLDGHGRMRTLRSALEVSRGTIVRIGAGAFHTTENVGGGDLDLVEVELPRNKLDLVRLSDRYRRELTPYEVGHKFDPNCRLRKVGYLPQCRMRSTSPDGRYGFQVRAGMDLYYRPQPRDVCHIPLGAAGVIRGEVDVLVGHGGARRPPQVDHYYLSIQERVA